MASYTSSPSAVREKSSLWNHQRFLADTNNFKMLIFDCKEMYIGSANLTGAGIGMKTDNKRNFEAGTLTDDPEIV